MWNIETGHRQSALWASSAPALSNVNVSKHSVCAMLPGMVDRSEFVLTAGNDQKIRFWDMASPKNCSMIVPAPKDNLNQADVTYDSRLIDGTEVLQEIVGQQSSSSPGGSSGGGGGGGGIGGGGSGSNRNIEEPPRSGPELPAAGHHDVITDMVMCKTQKQMFLVSSSRDGVIKLWK